MLTAKRTLVKSGPELWAEVSDPEALGSLFAPFGEIRITRVTDASLVVWEGERAAGRLELEPSGFGTRVHLSAEVGARELPPPPASEPEPAPRPGFWSRLFRRAPERGLAAAAAVRLGPGHGRRRGARRPHRHPRRARHGAPPPLQPLSR